MLILCARMHYKNALECTRMHQRAPKFKYTPQYGRATPSHTLPAICPPPTSDFGHPMFKSCRIDKTVSVHLFVTFSLCKI